MIATVAATLLLWVVPPAPSPMPAVHYEASCPSGPATWGCYVPNEVFLPPKLIDRDLLLQAELGHAYDHNNLSGGERARIAKVLGWKTWHAENFADFYQGCRLALDPHDLGVRLTHTYGPFRDVQRVARRCALIARAGL